MIEQFKLPGTDIATILESRRSELGQQALRQAVASIQELVHTA